MKEKIVILGAGESGVGAALLAKAKGYDLFVSDSGEIKSGYKKELVNEGIAFEEKKHTPSQILDASTIIKSPGIPENSTIMKEVRKNNIRVISEIEFAVKHSQAQMVAITGTNGKTTTTLLTYHLLKNSGFNVGLAGNVGTSLARQVSDEKIAAKDLYVIELSSFQLDDLYDFRAHVAVLLNITPDHLDRYDNDFTKYRDSKFSILRNMKREDAFVYWADDPVISAIIDETKIDPQQIDISISSRETSAFLEKDEIMVNSVHFPLDDMPLKGRHNYINMMAAISTALFLGAAPDLVKKAIQTYINAPHRMELAGVIDGIVFINDSKATNVDSTYYALDAYDTHITWIAGGVDKGNDYQRLIPLVTEKVKTLICLGTDNAKLKSAFGSSLENILETTDIKQAARMGYEYSKRNDTVLLSPACASFDLFKNYEDRGDQFKSAVKELKQKTERATKI